MTQRLTIRTPDDWHVHLRDAAMLDVVADSTARQFGRAIVMPNLVPPVTSTAMATAYRDRIVAAVAANHHFTPLMTCYLVDDAVPDGIVQGYEAGVFAACKLYPAHATTNSAHGVTDVRRIRPVLEAMQRVGMPLLVHGEVTERDVDIFDREAVFIDRVLDPLRRDFPALRIVLEHITTRQAVDYVTAADDRLAATITPHHLHINRNAMFDGGIRPHAYCLPVAKREEHRLALRRAATSGSAKFFLGTDSAPHMIERKESGCGCAGVFNAPYALESYLQVFDEEGALDRFEGFAAEHGARFYGLPLNEGTVTFDRSCTDVPATIEHGGITLVPFHAGQRLDWRLVS